jgi:ribose/xylose/arabinose/galactoside ABC-type transport system permease subunit
VSTIAREMRSPRRPVAEVLASIARRREYGVAILLALTVLVVSLVNPDFLTPGNLRDILVRNAAYAIIACGVTFVIVTGEIDISVGSLAGLLAATLGVLTSPDRAGLGAPIAVTIALALGLAVGLVNGFLVAYARVPSIIVTLGMLTALSGVTRMLMAGTWIEVVPGLRALGTGRIAGIDLCVLLALAVAIASAVFATRTPIGRRVYAVGSNPHAARLAGLSPRRIKLLVFAMTGLLVGVATLFDATRLPRFEDGYGRGSELFIVTAVIVGGTSISGGKGTILGTLLAVVLLGMIGNVLTLLRLGPDAVYWERAIQGGFILLAVLADHLGGRRAAHAEDGG